MTNNTPATVQSAVPANRIEFTRDQLDLIKDTVAKGTTDNELALFLHQCQRAGLDPLAKQIYCIVRGRGDKRKATIQTGIDGYRLIADRTGKYAGSDEPAFDLDSAKKPTKATVTVWKLVQGQRCPFTASALMSEYRPENDGAGLWTNKPFTMLGKVAEALALRKAFPADLSGMHTAEELDQAEVPTYAPQEPAQPDNARTREKPKAQPAAKTSGESGGKSGPADEKALVARLRREIERRAPDHPKVKDGTLVSKGPAIIWKIAKQVGVVDEHGKFVPDPNEPAEDKAEPAPAEPEASSEEAKPEPAPKPEPEAKKEAATGYAQFWLQLCEEHGWDPHDALAWIQANGHGEVKALMKLDPKTKAGKALRGAIRGKENDAA